MDIQPTIKISKTRHCSFQLEPKEMAAMAADFRTMIDNQIKLATQAISNKILGIKTWEERPGQFPDNPGGSYTANYYNSSLKSPLYFITNTKYGEGNLSNGKGSSLTNKSKPPFQPIEFQIEGMHS